MKGLRLLFYVCLGMLAFGRAIAVDGDDTARAATRRSTSSTTITTTARGAPTTTTKTNATPRTATVAPRTAATESRGATQVQNVIPRTASSRSAPATRPNVQNRTATPISQTRHETATRTATSRTATSSRTAVQKKRPKRTLSRAATSESGALMTTYTKCRTIFYECMDEFCATKDANLRRCACSSRFNEFDGIKKQMDNVENKMLDFNQRLLMVNMDAEDVNAINNATEGEDAFYSTRDTTKSKRVLDDIAKKLNAKFGDTDSSSSSTGLGAISLTLNVDAAFDTVDSFMGIDTTTKSGVALYNAAIPVCHDIASEVCTDEELSLAQSGYQMQIEQDCNTVKKAYQSQADQARAKVFESGALLDMSRLDAYQTRNSDDLLTCKRKMLEMLTDTTVCGAKMEKCLDMTGRYIDPTTGKAFLSVNLADLDTMILRPGVNQTWTSANSSGKFITFLNDRKKFLQTATEHCESIADTVWDGFIEDALAQIKLAQTAKLEEIRQACTKLTTECLEHASDSIEEFDARALSIFGVMADKAANTMCAEVQTSCANLLGATGDASWETGVHEISTNITYESILSSCTQVGQNCIIQACKSISSNFGLCNDIDFSPNRHSILERTACWGEVLDCVAAAGDDAIISIMTQLNPPQGGSNPYSFYNTLYNAPEYIDDICANQCDDSDFELSECGKCRIAERIWGNCEAPPTTTVGSPAHNQILIYTPSNNGQSTLLSWFASNTNTNDDPRSCVNVRCDSNHIVYDSTGTEMCYTDDQAQNVTDGDHTYCPANTGSHLTIIVDETQKQNCCPTGQTMGSTGPCCVGNLIADGICTPNNNFTNVNQLGTKGNTKIYCIGTISGDGSTNGEFPQGDQVTCNGVFVIISNDQKYYGMQYNDNISGTIPNGTKYTPQMGYYTGPHNNDGNFQPFTTTIDDDSSWFIRYITTP
ncbi:MAG: hypothetical protein J6Y07_03535 [Alphaproteobacteria bacterium]|nr:hypothetical protein [Alphaproteobacteria bacterium]